MSILSIFSTRELVSAIYLLCFFIFGITKKVIRSSFVDLLKAFFCWKIIIPILVLILYGIVPILIAKRFSFWKWIYIKDVVFWLIFAGLPCVLNVSAAKEKDHFKSILLNNIKFAVIVEFIISSFTFSIVVEFLLQPVLLFLMLLQLVAESKDEYKKIAHMLSIIMTLIGFSILFSSIKIAMQSLTKDNEIDLLVSFLIPIVYSFLYLPFAYLLALYSEYEQLYIRIKVVYENIGMINSADNKLLKTRFWMIVKECRFSIKNILLIDGSLLVDIYSAKNEEEFESFIRKLSKKKEKNKMDKKPLFDRTGMKIFQLVLYIVTGIIASLACIPQIDAFFHTPEHNLEISVPDVKVNEKSFVIPMIFKNEGDFDEILTTISLDFFDGDYHVLQLSETEDIFLFQKKSNYTKIFETEIDFEKKDKTIYEYFLGNKTLSVELVFEFATQDNKHVTTRIKLGDVSINEAATEFDMRIAIPYKEIDFSDAKEKIIIENYPRTNEYDAFKLLERKK